MATSPRPAANTSQKQAEIAELRECIAAAVEKEIGVMAELMASKADNELFGETEFQLRDIVHRLGAKVIEITAQQREKKGRVRGC